MFPRVFSNFNNHSSSHHSSFAMISPHLLIILSVFSVHQLLEFSVDLYSLFQMWSD